MAGYALRYYKDYGVQDSIVKLEIYKKYPAPEFAPAPKEIGGVLTSARLVMQGDQDDVTVPIIKTSLELSLVDAPDTEYGRMTGPWEEFYTPDSTEFFIKVLVDDVVEWTGYVTPDSYEEDITAFGIVTITARDNIGHLQDFLFEENGNADGMISVQDLFTKAWQLIEARQNLVIADEPDVIWPECYGYRPYELMLNVEAFKDKNWYEVIESVLDSLGLALRYVGHNEFRIYPLRSLPLLDKSSFNFVESQPILFQAAGHRSLQRACKEIVDDGKYDVNKSPACKTVRSSDFLGVQLTYRCKIEGDTWSRLEHDAPIWPIRNADYGKGWLDAANDKTLFFDQNQYSIGYFLAREESVDAVMGDTVMYIAANNVDDREIAFSKLILCRDLSIRMKFGRPLGLSNSQNLECNRNANLHKITYGVTFEDATGVYHWDGSEWKLQNSSIKLVRGFDYTQPAYEFVADIKLGMLEKQSGLLTFYIYKIEYRLVGPVSVANIGIYARIVEFAYSILDNDSYSETFKAVVNYDKNSNNLISRQSEFLAPLNTFFSPKVVVNGIYVPEEGYPPARPWNWPGEDVKTELQVLVAQQILLYNSKPNNLLTGTLVSDEKMLRLPGIWTYNDKNHILISGSLDLLTGYLEDVKLREYLRWPELYPDDFYLMTEDDQNVVTEGNNKVVISAREYRLLLESGDEFRTEDNNYIKMN